MGFAALFISGCQGEDTSLDPTPGQPATPTAAQRLAKGATFALDLTASEVSVNGAALPPIAGHAMVTATAAGQLRLEQLHVVIGAIDIPAAALPPTGLQLRDVSVTLVAARGARADWSPDHSAGDTTMPVDLELRWSFVSPTTGDTVPLTPQRIESVPLDLAVSAGADGHLIATIAGRRDGTFFDWLGGRVKLENLRFALTAHE